MMSLFIPISGEYYRAKAVSAAVELMDLTRTETTDIGVLPLGISLHAGTAYVGKVGEGEVSDFTALGDTVNTAARIQAEAGRRRNSDQ